VRRFVWLVALLVVGVSAGLVAQDLRIRLRRINNHTPPSTFTATWTVNSTGPITMGLVAPEGSLAAGEGVQVGSFTTQTDVLNTWADGSTRHAIVSFNATSTGAKTVTPITNPGGSYTPTWPSASVAFAITAGLGNGSTYTATLPSFTSTDCIANGAVSRRCRVVVVPDTGGTPHGTLQVVFEITSYQVGGHEVDICIQQTKNSASVSKITSNLTTTVAGSGFSAMTASGFIMHTGQRFRKKTTTSLTNAVVLHDFEPWIDAHVIPRISPSVDTKTYDIDPATNDTYDWLGAVSGVTGARQFGEADSAMGNSENADRQELNPITDWEARLFALNTETYRQVVLANGEQSGNWSIHVSSDTGNTGLSTHWATTHPDASMHTVNAGTNSGFNWPASGTTRWEGAYWLANVPTGVVGYDDEHPCEMNFVAYLLTGETFFGDQLRFHASWSSLQAITNTQEQDPYKWPGWMSGRNGTQGIVSYTGVSREFGRPFKLLSRAAWAARDGATDQDDLKTLTENNLEYIADYIDYIDARGWTNYGTWTSWVGMWPLSSAWYLQRYNSVSSTTGASPTVLTVIGDDSGVGTGINDHNAQTGDYVTLEGFSGGAAGLNGRHAITRLSATTFSVAVNTTGSATSGVGTYSFDTGAKVPTWRVGTGAWAVYWALKTGYFTARAEAWEFPERNAHNHVALQDSPTFDTNPGLSHNYYPSPYYVAGNDYVFFTNWSDYRTANEMNTSTARLFGAESEYTSHAVHFGTHHRGGVDENGKLFDPANPNSYYSPYANMMLSAGSERNVSGAETARVRNLAATGVLTEVKRRPGYYIIPD
jgi:hypothetical protein